jgi:hypothetical protein
MDGWIGCMDGWMEKRICESALKASEQTAAIERVENGKNTAGDSLFGNGVSTNPDGV